ncbi:M24 family metallopeptidase [Cohnella nanjingensis]|uniref:Aminopeptidase P family protein n=1 Tax=Cohnella nanjingensis TaxID=1387779 RepID=A0A7X0VFW2_9BACL|nr:Xaa-Pro peptidase family protein [Cohnella nanjingensis]MBB6671034.1 aminopeptidase P family protein [Cohnella nanjingensis]
MESIWDNRKSRLLAHMKAAGIDVALVTSPTNVYYLTDFACHPHERFLALVLDARAGTESLYVPLLDEPAARESAGAVGIVPVADTEDPYALLKGRVQAGARIVGVEKGAVSLAQAERLGVVFPDSSYADLESGLLAMRLRKSEEEVAKIQRAVDLIEEVVAHAAAYAKEGMTELELAAEIEYRMRKLGADRPAFESIVLTGPRTALPHGTPGPYPIQRGDFVLIDIGVQVDGYCSDITRTFVMGEPSEAQRRIYETVLAANLAGIAASRAGVPVAAVDRAARQVIEEAGYGPLFTHRVGHGFGMDVHEQPSMSGQNETVMAPGLVFTIEPGIYDPVIGGVRIEDDIYLNEDGTARVLTRYPKALTRLGGV